jgi:hypothetical protein
MVAMVVRQTALMLAVAAVRLVTQVMAVLGLAQMQMVGALALVAEVVVEIVQLLDQEQAVVLAYIRVLVE